MQPLTLSRAWVATLAVGIRPCSGAIIVLVFALSQNLLLVGIGLVLLMALGTFLTVSALAALAVFAKDMALRFASGELDAARRITRILEIGALLPCWGDTARRRAGGRAANPIVVNLLTRRRERREWVVCGEGHGGLGCVERRIGVGQLDGRIGLAALRLMLQAEYIELLIRVYNL